MRCRNCGQILESGSRFCTYCDCDNYPEMNRVKTKNDHTVSHTSQPNKTYRPVQNSNWQAKNVRQAKPKKKNSGLGVIIVAIIIIYIIIMALAGDM